MKQIIIAMIVVFGLQSCGSSMSAVWQKDNYAPRTFKNVAVIAISKNLEARQSLEQDVIEGLKETHPNVHFIKGVSLFPPSTTKDDWTKESVEVLFKELKIDAVITTSLINSYISSQYVQSSGIYYPRYYNVGSYIYGTYNYLYTPEYYEQSQNFVLQSSIFDLKEGSDAASTMIWKGESKVTDPSSISSGASRYANNLVKYINEEGIFAKE